MTQTGISITDTWDAAAWRRTFCLNRINAVGCLTDHPYSAARSRMPSKPCPEVVAGREPWYGALAAAGTLLVIIRQHEV
jgi:hypothetical protein